MQARLVGSVALTTSLGLVPSDADRAPPPVTGSIGRSYNQIYYDRGDRHARVGGEIRTSLITFPADGRIPALTPEGARRKQAYEARRARFGEYDHPELRPLAEHMLYEFEVHDPATYTEPWGGEVPWRRYDDQLYEYACHEGNYAMESILRGARYQERAAGR